MPAVIPLIAVAGSAYAANKQNQTAKDAAKSQQQQNTQDRQFQVEMANQARNDVTAMYPQMQQNTMLGGQAALTTMRNAMPQQTYARQQGTQNAIAALLGGQGKQIQPNFDFMPQQLPNYQTYKAPVQTVGPQQSWTPPPNNLSGLRASRLVNQILGGYQRGVRQ